VGSRFFISSKREGGARIPRLFEFWSFMTDRTERLFWTDLARVLAVFGVVIVHVAADVITEWNRLPSSWWWAANVFDSLTRGCVPLFVMLSGALLLPKQESLRDFFTKRFRRIFIPAVVWVAIYLAWKKIFYAPSLGPAEAVRLVVNGGVYFHLWFLYLIMGLYLLTPVLRGVVGGVPQKILCYFLALCFFVSSVATFWAGLDQKILHTGLRFSLSMEMAQGFTGYFVLGHVIRKASTGKWRGTAFVVWIACLLVNLFGTFFLTRRLGGYQPLFYDNMAPNVVLYTAAGFLLLKEFGEGIATRFGAKFRRGITHLSSGSFGIYLAHVIFLDTLIKGRLGFTLKGDLFHPAWMIPLTALVVYAVSFFTVLGIQKIPFLRRVV